MNILAICTISFALGFIVAILTMLLGAVIERGKS
jgi:hypothetical protein